MSKSNKKDSKIKPVDPAAIRLEALREAARVCQGVVNYLTENNRNPFSARQCVQALEELIGAKPWDKADEVGSEIYRLLKDGTIVDARAVSSFIRARMSESK